MKKLTCALLLLITTTTFANEKTPIKSADPTPVQLSIAEKLWLFCKTFCLNKDAFCDSCTQLKLLVHPANTLTRDSAAPKKNKFPFSTLVLMAIKDFILYDSLTQNNPLLTAHPLTMQQKADIMNALIGWEGFAHVDSAKHYIWFDFMVPQKVYKRSSMRNTAEGYAAIAYAWLLRNEDINQWSMLVHFSKQKKHRVKYFGTRVYSYFGKNYLIISSLFGDALANQLSACKKCF